MTVHVSRQGAEVAHKTYRLLQDQLVASWLIARQVLHGLGCMGDAPFSLAATAKTIRLV